MSEEMFPVALAGRQWNLPHLPFRVIKVIQPLLLQIFQDAGGAKMSAASIAQLSESHLDRLAQACWRALAHVDQSLSLESFLDLPFSVSELMQTFPAIAKAAGLRSGDSAAAEASSPPGK